MRAKVIAVDSFGAIVQFPGGVKALCPTTHMSEFEISKPGKKFKVISEMFNFFFVILLSSYCMISKCCFSLACVTLQIGAELVFRVLGCKSKRITVTYKKTLVCSYFLLIFYAA